MAISVYNLIVSGDCNNTGSGAVSFGVTGGTAPYAITCINSTLPPTSALTGPYDYTAISLTADTYFLQITDAGSYSIIQSIYISSGTTATIDSTPTSCGLNNGSVTGFTSGAYGNVKFSLYDGSDNFIISAQTPTSYYEFLSLSAGTYYIVADDGGGCTGITASVILTPSTGFTFGDGISYSGSLPIVSSGSFGSANGPLFGTQTSLCSMYDQISATNIQGLVNNDYTNSIAILSNPDEFDYEFISVPGLTTQNSVVDALIAVCQNRGDCMAIVDLANYGSTIASVSGEANTLDSSYAAAYWPWVQVSVFLVDFVVTKK